MAGLIGSVTTQKNGLALRTMRYIKYNVNETSYLEMEIPDYQENFYIITFYQDGITAMAFLMVSTYKKEDCKLYGVFNGRSITAYVKNNNFYLLIYGGNSHFSIRSINHNEMTAVLKTGSFDTNGATKVTLIELIS